MNKLLLLLTLMSAPAFAEMTRIHSIHDTFIKFENGQVGYQTSLKINFDDFSSGQLVSIQLGNKNSLLQIVPVNESSLVHPPHLNQSQQNAFFVPTTLSSYKAATNLLLSFSNQNLASSQCYDRAHVWAYTAGMNSNPVQLEKAWLFFSDDFISRNQFPWWFHIAPMATVMMQGSQQKRIMDRSFSEYPLKQQLWTDLFMPEKQECKKIEVYTEYSEHPLEDDCYVLISTPYFWQPKDLEAFVRKNKQKTSWIDWEVRHAFKHAFGIEM